MAHKKLYVCCHCLGTCRIGKHDKRNVIYLCILNCFVNKHNYAGIKGARAQKNGLQSFILKYDLGKSLSKEM